MKKNILAIILIFSSFSCFITTSGFVKQNEGVILIENDIPISIKVTENTYINKDSLEKSLQNYFSKYNRTPPFVLVNDNSKNSILLNIDVKSLNFDSQIIDKTSEKKEEEKNDYKKRLDDYEREKKLAEEFKKEPPKEIEPPNEETVSYIIKRFILKSKIEMVINDNINEYNETLYPKVEKDIVIEHKIRKIKQNAIFSHTPTGNVFTDITATIFTGVLNMFFMSSKETNNKENYDENALLSELQNRLFLEIDLSILSRINPYFVCFVKGDIYLLPINKDIDSKIKIIMNDKKDFLKIFDFLKNLANQSNSDVKARIFFNLYFKDNKQSKFYYDLGNEEKFTWTTANIFNSILPYLGKEYLKEE
ncbi:MAG TPA: hypothetical protein PK771_00690 [Spirochaetota bacterium]|nr:hypothetical protein [Spirochaetota bacterium]